MSLTRWNPYRELMSFQNMMDRFFSERRPGEWGELTDGGFGMPMDLVETGDKYVLTAELPGIDPKDVDITITGNTLTIKGEVKEEKESEEGDVHYRERRFGKFQRSAALPVSVDPDKVDATFENGILKLEIPKKEEAKPKQIPVKTK